jgi:diguanylate cyclase (GGDEF)-like protein
MSSDADGTLWAGTSRGLARVRGGHAILFSTRHGLHGNTVFQALDDGAGALWLMGPRGISRVPRAELDAVAAGRARTVSARGFDVSDGLAVREVSSIGGGWRAEDGTLLFPTPAGVARIDPRKLPRNTARLAAHIERVRANDTEFSGTAPVEVPAGRRRLEIQFTAPSFVAPEELRFRYRLEGFDQGWVDSGKGRVAFYTNVPPGRYTFRVQARNEDGVWSGATASVPLHLHAHFWQTRWFLALAALAVAAGIVGVHRLRLRAAESASREEVLREMSLRDELTGLYNRRALFGLAEQRMQTAMRTGAGFHILFIDMDGLKAINDTLGHQQGDRALRDAAALLSSNFRRSDVVARLGGDEFAVLLLGRTPRDRVSGAGVDAAVARLHAELERQTATARRPYTLSLSVGASHFDPAAPASLEELLHRADQKMYASKRLRARTRAHRPEHA